MGRRHFEKAVAAATILLEGGSAAAAALQVSGGLGASLLPFPAEENWSRVRSFGTLAVETAVATLQNGGNGAAALQEGSSGGGDSTGRWNGGGGSAGQRRSGRVPSPLFRLGRTGRGLGRLARWRRKRRRRFCRTAETSAAVLQDGGVGGGDPAGRQHPGRVFLFPYSLPFKGDPRSGFPLSLSREYGRVTST